ncbi:hypothetical protein LX32DRAFT_693436 [Colletotrichum zoysiae]|uniref:Uncharacterized protein n=1 Tax=Colletotrichum zoysiae TaxID=1216348 RepID=A0AAD9HHZ7_9PEZI|nr:hypothetical protein LX32DRAFT_693436 [Colletotrichum zoysiae]
MTRVLPRAVCAGFAQPDRPGACVFSAGYSQIRRVLLFGSRKTDRSKHAASEPSGHLCMPFLGRPAMRNSSLAEYHRLQLRLQQSFIDILSFMDTQPRMISDRSRDSQAPQHGSRATSSRNRSSRTHMFDTCPDLHRLNLPEERHASSPKNSGFVNIGEGDEMATRSSCANGADAANRRRLQAHEAPEQDAALRRARRALCASQTAEVPCRDGKVVLAAGHGAAHDTIRLRDGR